MDKKRIVITGIGVVSPIGIGKDAYWQGLQEGKSGIKLITLFDTSDFDVKVGGEITDFNAKEILGRRGLVDLDRATTLLLASAKFALEDDGLEIDENNTYRTGVSVGTTFGSLNSILEFDKESIIDGPKFVNPSRFPNTVINSPSSRVAIRHGIKGLNSTVSTGICSGLDSVDYAVHQINSNKGDRILVGSVEEMCIQTFLGFYRLGYLSGISKNSNPVSCPFDKTRDGIVFGEGASIVIFEELNLALKRKAKIYAEVLSVSSNFDPYKIHRYNPRANGISKAMKFSLKNANIEPNDIDCIFANANSTKDADLVEARAIKKRFGELSSKVPITAIKSMVGETFSASGGLSLVAALGSINQGFIPQCVNLNEADFDFDLNFIRNKAKKSIVNKVMLNAFSPNGANTVVILGKFTK